MFNPIKSDQNHMITPIQQCLANYDYSNAILLAENLLLNQDSEENKGLLADCYLAQQGNHKAYFLLKNSKSPLNTHKFAVACVRLNRLAEAEKVLTRGCLFDDDNVPNGAYGLQLLASIYKKQNKRQQAKRYYEKALESNPMLLAIKKKLKKLGKKSTEVKSKNTKEFEERQPSKPSGFKKKPISDLFGEDLGEGSGFGTENGFEIQGKVGQGPVWIMGRNQEEKLAKEKGNRKKDDVSIVGDVKQEKKIKSIEAVDQYFDEEDYEIYTSEEGKFYAKMLHQETVDENNDKFFVLQVLQSRKEKGNGDIDEEDAKDFE